MTYEATTEGIEVIDGVQVDITVRGEQDKAEKTMMDLKEQCGRIAAAFEQEEPPRDLSEFPVEYMPMMTVAWDQVFEDE